MERKTPTPKERGKKQPTEIPRQPIRTSPPADVAEYGHDDPMNGDSFD